MLRCYCSFRFKQWLSISIWGEKFHTHMFKAGNWSCYKAIAIDVVTPAETFHGDCCWNKINLDILQCSNLLRFLKFEIMQN